VVVIVVGVAAVAGCRTAGGSGGVTGGSTVRDANIARSEVPEEFRWDLAPLFADDAAFEAGLVEAARMREELAGCRGDQGSLAAPERLEDCLERYFRARLLTNRLTLYAQLQQATDTASSEVQARADRSQAAMSALMGLAAELRGGILGLDQAALDQALADRPALGAHRAYIQRMRARRDHVLGEEGERVLALVGDNQWAEIDLNELPSDHERAFGAFISELPLPTITDGEGAPVQLTLSNYGMYRADPDRRVRREAVEGLFSSLRAFEGTFAALLGGQARFTVSLARARGYETSLDAYLVRDEIDPDIYRNLVRAVEANAAPLHRYVELRRRRMGLDELHVYDLYTPLVPAVERQVPYDEAARIIQEALAPLGDGYLAVLRRGMDPREGWLDLYPHRDRESGAFSSSVYGVHPYVFMNYFESVDDMSTLAHEFGHALHSHLSMSSQPYDTFNYVPLVAETASTFNEVLVIRHLIDQAASDDERIALLGELVEMIRTTIYRQSLFASFELALHEAVERGEPVTPALLDQTYRTLLARYYGEALTLGEDDGMEWAYVPHFYYKYYMFSYAMGLCSGIALGDRVLAGGAAERDAYLAMLAAGSSRPPIDLLRAAGVDPTDPAAVEAAARLMDESLSQMEALLAARSAP
jgi:oligoendopeptidase F